MRAKSSTLGMEDSWNSLSFSMWAESMWRQRTEPSPSERRRVKVLEARLAARASWSPARRRTAMLLENVYFDFAMAAVLIFNVGIMVGEANQTVRCISDASCGSDKMMKAFDVANWTLLAIYTAEASIRFYVQRCSFFFQFTNLLDLIVVIAAFIDQTIFAVTASGDDLPSIQILKIFRACRLVRIIRLAILCPQLYRMVRSFASAMTAMMWGFVMVTCFLLIISILSVELIHPVNVMLPHDDEDDWCSIAFSQVHYAMLLYFQSLVAGDSWGSCTIPLVRESPSLILMFVAACVCVQFGLLNIVLSSIVEGASAAHEHDVQQRCKERDHDKFSRAKELHRVLDRVDKNSDKHISLQEFIAAFDEDEEVNTMFTLLDIDRTDLESVFDLMDVDKSGNLAYSEFVTCIERSLSKDPRLQMMALKLQVHNMCSNHMVELRKQVSRIKLQLNQITREMFGAVFLHSDHEAFEGTHMDISPNVACRADCGQKLASKNEKTPPTLVHHMERAVAESIGQRTAIATDGVHFHTTNDILLSTISELLTELRQLTTALSDHRDEQAMVLPIKKKSCVEDFRCPACLYDENGAVSNPACANQALLDEVRAGNACVKQLVVDFAHYKKSLDGKLLEIITDLGNGRGEMKQFTESWREAQGCSPQELRSNCQCMRQLASALAHQQREQAILQQSLLERQALYGEVSHLKRVNADLGERLLQHQNSNDLTAEPLYGEVNHLKRVSADLEERIQQQQNCSELMAEHIHRFEGLRHMEDRRRLDVFRRTRPPQPLLPRRNGIALHPQGLYAGAVPVSSDRQAWSRSRH